MTHIREVYPQADPPLACDCHAPYSACAGAITHMPYICNMV